MWLRELKLKGADHFSVNNTEVGLLGDASLSKLLRRNMFLIKNMVMYTKLLCRFFKAFSGLPLYASKKQPSRRIMPIFIHGGERLYKDLFVLLATNSGGMSCAWDRARFLS